MSRSTRLLAASRTARADGDLAEAARLAGAGFARFQRRGDASGMAASLVEIAVVALDGEDEDTASRALAEALDRLDPVAGHPPLAAAITVVARLAAVGDDPETAVRLYVGADACALDPATLAAIRRDVGGPVWQRSRDVVDGGPGADPVPAGAAMSLDEVVDLARARASR
jgi:hypothetical protein